MAVVVEDHAVDVVDQEVDWALMVRVIDSSNHSNSMLDRLHQSTLTTLLTVVGHHNTFSSSRVSNSSSSHKTTSLVDVTERRDSSQEVEVDVVDQEVDSEVEVVRDHRLLRVRCSRLLLRRHFLRLRHRSRLLQPHKG